MHPFLHPQLASDQIENSSFLEKSHGSHWSMLFTCGTPKDFITHVYICTYTEYIHGIFYVYLDTDTYLYHDTNVGRFPTDPTPPFRTPHPFSANPLRFDVAPARSEPWRRAWKCLGWIIPDRWRSRTTTIEKGHVSFHHPNKGHQQNFARIYGWMIPIDFLGLF